jgi:biotin transport system substrate-specific component
MHIESAALLKPRQLTLPKSALVELGMVAAGAGVVAAAAQVAIYLPGTPVPVTLQTFGVLVVGMVLGPWRGASALLAYLAAGAAGAPVFAGAQAGLTAFAGPTAGYLVGFVPAAMLVGGLARLGFDRRVWSALIAMIVGTAVIFLCGAGWLAVWFGRADAVAIGVVPFLPGAVIKIMAAAALLPALRMLVEKLRPEPAFAAAADSEQAG